MPKATTKENVPVSRVRRYLEPGPIVLVSSMWEEKSNIMTMGWHTVMEFSPSLVGCVISSGDHSYDPAEQGVRQDRSQERNRSTPTSWPL